MFVSAWQGLTFDTLCKSPHRGPLPFPFDAPHKTCFHTARSAIYQLFAQLVRAGRKRVLAPDYHMGNELRAIRAAGADVRLYPVGPDMQPDLDEMRRLCRQGADVLFTIHYAGWPQPLHELRTLSDEHGMVMVEDCALALLSESGGRPVGSFGDYAVFCLYKTLPVPDGGMLVQNRNVFHELDAWPLQPIGTVFEAGRLAELWIDGFRNRYPKTGAAFASCKRGVGALLNTMQVTRIPVGDIGFDAAQCSLAMSRWSERIIPRLDFLKIRSRRRDNYQLVSHLFHHAGHPVFRTLEAGVCPLFFPLLVRDKHAAARALWSRGIMATELWNEGDPAFAHSEGAGTQFLRRHVLELPIHQDITESKIRYMVQQVLHLKISLEPAMDSALRTTTAPTPCGDAVSGTCVGSA